MSEEKPKYQGKPRGGAGLGQGKKKSKVYVRKSFDIDIKVADILSEYHYDKGFPKGTMIEFLEIATLELHKQFQDLLTPGTDATDTYFNFQERKENLFKKVADKHKENLEQFL